MLEPGSRVGPFEVISSLGAGGMGEVYRARDPRLEREIALKVLPAHRVADETARKRMLREARLAASLNHPNVCTIHEVGEADGHTYIAMELVSGQTLSARLEGGPIAVDEALRLGQQLAEALAHAHERGLVHRDFKSGNVIITPEGRAKILDFGLAKQVVSEEVDTAATTQASASLTKPGMVVGTLAYMAPEQLRGRAADARSDVWALGIVLYEMMSGTRPFTGGSAFELSSAILNQPPRPLPFGVPPALVAVVERCLVKEPAQRYQRAGEVGSALQALLSGGGPAAWPGWRSILVARRRQAALAALAAASALVIALDVGGVRGRLLGGGGDQARAIRMAVLPFANLTGDPEQEYLSDGVTQEMITQLGRLHPGSLSVIARTSVMRYKQGDTPVDQIGRELKVDYILEGSARREANRVRITAELIQVRDQTQLWADTYERDLSGLLALQGEVAQRVARALALKLLPAEQARLANVRTVNPEAYEAFLKGTYHRQSLSVRGFEAAERYYTLALQKDPTYAAAWAGLARVWSGRAQMGITPSKDAIREAKAAALKAIELDETDWEAHRALAGILTWGEWDWPAAERMWKQVISLNPNHPEGLQGYSHFLLNMNRLDEGMRQIERALELDPFSVRNQGFYATALVYARRYDEAIAAARTTLRQEPDTLLARSALYEALLMKGLRSEALDLDRKMFADDRELMEALERGEAEAGYGGAQREAAQILAVRAGGGGGATAYALARRWLYAGDKDRALEWLEKAYEAHDNNMPYLGMPIFDSLRSDPRFQELLRRMNLPLN